jgi:hypothetical protein
MQTENDSSSTAFGERDLVYDRDPMSLRMQRDRELMVDLPDRSGRRQQNEQGNGQMSPHYSWVLCCKRRGTHE